MRIILSSPGPGLDSLPSPVKLCSILRIRSWRLLTRSFKLVISSNVGAMVCYDYESVFGDEEGRGDLCEREGTKKTRASYGN